MDYRDYLEVRARFYGEDEALENLTIGMVKQDNIECCVCLNFHWGVKLPNCNHFICPKCYYKIYHGFISSKFYRENPEPHYSYDEKPIYPYQNVDKNREIFNTITNDPKFLEWFVNDNEDLYNSIKTNSDFVDNIDANLETWFKNNDLIQKYNDNLINYKNKVKQFHIDLEEYNELYEEEKECNSKQLCPLCRL